MNEMMMLRNMFSGMFGSAGLSWLQVALLLSLFGIFLFVPTRIQHPTIFRWACTIFALSIILPPFVESAVSMWLQTTASGMGRRGPSEGAWLLVLPQTVGPLLVGISVMLSFTSLTMDPAARKAAVAATAEPRPHPLD